MLTEQVFQYCERGSDGSFWAEPVNAATNAAFVLAAILAAARLRTTPGGSAAARMALWLLVAVVAVIGIGSFLFHTFATRWALLADVLPITIFMLGYLAFAIRSLLGAGWAIVALALPIFLVSGHAIGGLTCGVGADGRPLACLNGSLGYVPALVTLGIVGGLLLRSRPAIGGTLLAAGCVFLVSLTFRSIDREVCEAAIVHGHALGTHAMWHILNGVTLYMLLAAGIASLGRDSGPARG
jgi:hypothetical protein